MTDSVRQGIEKFGVFCFGVLDLDGRSAELTIRDESGLVRFSHRFAGA